MKNIFKREEKKTVRDSILKQIKDVESQLENSSYDSGEYHRLMDEYLKLIDRYNEMEKNKAHPVVDYGLKVASIVIPAGITIWGTIVTMNYEKEDIVNNTAGKQFFKRIFTV